MSLSALKIDPSIALDRKVTAGGYEKIENSDIYNMVIEYAIERKSARGALGIEFHMKSEGGANFRTTVWMTNAAGEHTFIDKQTGKPAYMPGFATVNNICLLTVGKNLPELAVEEKVVKLWEYSQSAEVPTKVQMVTDLMKQPIKLGLLKTLEDKNTQNAAGAWVPSGETRTVMVIDKAFRARDNMSVLDITAEETVPQEFDNWLTRNKDRVVDRTAAAKGGVVTPARPMAAPIAAAPTPAPSASLFG